MGALHGYSYTYGYDAAGNRLSKTVGGTTTSYTYDSANKLTAAGTKSYSYDSAGSVTSVYNSGTGIATTLGYDGESRMKSASNNPSTGAFSNTFGYNGNDQRYAKSDNTGSFSYTRAGDEVDDSVLSDGAAIYNHGADVGLVSEVRGSASKFYHSDALGSTGALTNSSGSTTDTLVTDSFGMTVAGSGSTPSPFGFVGQGGYQSDSDTGLMLLGHRYYDSSVGRFLSRDPMKAGYNWYTYCENDPVNVSDPEGTDPTNINGNQKKQIELAIALLKKLGGVHATAASRTQARLDKGQFKYQDDIKLEGSPDVTPGGSTDSTNTTTLTSSSFKSTPLLAAVLEHEDTHVRQNTPIGDPGSTATWRGANPSKAEYWAYTVEVDVITDMINSGIKDPAIVAKLKIARIARDFFGKRGYPKGAP